MHVAHPPKCTLAVIKIASRCNLNCSYCYMYNMGDETYREQPKAMSQAVIDATVERCAEHGQRHGMARFILALHGGEPLLAGIDRFEYLISHARQRFAAGKMELRLVLQTNGVLLDDAWCRFLKTAGVAVGISIDGPPAVHDRQRITHAGRGSYDAVLAGFTRAQQYGLDPGLLTVIDATSDTQQAYEHLKALRPAKVDFLLPEGNHVLSPPGLGVASRSTPYADWLLDVFERWWADAAPFRVRLFEQVVGAALGVPFRSDAFGNQENEVLVIETNGDIGPVDVLRAALPGSPLTGINVRTHSLDDALRQQAVALYRTSHTSLCGQCQRCPINEICGGGYLSHRFALHTGFDNPSVYCRDLTRIIVHLRERALSILPREVLEQANVMSWSLGQVMAAQHAV